MPATADATRTAEREITITRTFNAPRALVFKAWTDGKALAQWWGPKGFTNPVCEIDARVGGAIRIHMRSPDGSVYPMKGEFREIVAPERLVFTNIAIDAAGNPIIEGLTTVTFAEREGKTAPWSITPSATCRAWRPAGPAASTSWKRCWRAAVRPPPLRHERG
jgi:uncharacterized protein YndB with AHSA1/START domain